MPVRTPKVRINPELLVWARETAGLQRSHIARACSTSENAVAAWEEGSDSPTFRQLEDLARKASRPLSALFLPDPPPEPPLPEDFRVRPSREPGVFEAGTLAAFREARFLAAQTAELLDTLNSQLSMRLPGFSTEDDPETLGSEFRIRSSISVEDQLNWKSKYAALDAWRSMLFDLGVLVFQFPISSIDARGFSIEEPNVGVVGVSNKREDPVARCFSILHEVCHLCLSKPGVSAGESIFLRRLTRPEERLEGFCNRFAAAFLLPLHDSHVGHDLERTFDKLRGCKKSEVIEVARRYKVSKYVLLFRAREAGRLPSDLCWSICAEWKEDDKRTPPGKGPKRRASVRTRVSERGKRFVSLVFEALDAERISLHDAMDYLSLHPKDFEKARESAVRGRL